MTSLEKDWFGGSLKDFITLWKRPKWNSGPTIYENTKGIKIKTYFSIKFISSKTCFEFFLTWKNLSCVLLCIS